MNTGKDLQFKGLHPLFGIRACSNVFSGARYDLQGDIFNPPLKRLTDRIFTQWYFKHYNHEDDMPFGHDVADPFKFPYIKYHPAKIRSSQAELIDYNDKQLNTQVGSI